MIASLLAALAAATSASQASPTLPALPEVPGAPAWAGWLSTQGGALGGLALPTLATPGAGRLQLAATLDWHRGGDFLFPASTSQRTGWALSASYGARSWLEAYGALWFHSTNLFGPAALHTLGSYGDLDAGVKLVLPRRGPLSGGALLELDVPAGVGGFSLKGTGGRAAMLAGLSGRVGPVPLAATVAIGYRLDNSGNLASVAQTTFSTYALGISRYDRVEAGLALALPFERVSPSVELELEAPVARATPLPEGGHRLLARLTLGAQALLPGGLSWQGGLRWSLSRDGRLSERSLPVAGLAPQAPWQIFTSFGFSFEPRMPRLPRWSRDKQPEVAAHVPAAPTLAAPAKARLVIVAMDARAHLPVAGAWITFVDSADPGATTASDGKARLEHDAGPVTIAVAHEKYELWTEPLLLVAGEEKQLVVALQNNAADATVRGRIVGEDGAPLRARIALVGAGRGSEPRWFEAGFALPAAHGQYTLQATTPGHRADPVKLDLRPGETVTADLVLRRIAGEPTARTTAQGIEVARPLPFVSGRSALFPVALPVVGELAALLRADGRAFVVEVRVEADELPAGTDVEAQAQVLSGERARSLVRLLEDKGVPKGRLVARGGGLARGQLPLEITAATEEQRPRSSLQLPAGTATAALRGPP